MLRDARRLVAEAVRKGVKTATTMKILIIIITLEVIISITSQVEREVWVLQALVVVVVILNRLRQRNRQQDLWAAQLRLHLRSSPSWRLRVTVVPLCSLQITTISCIELQPSFQLIRTHSSAHQPNNSSCWDLSHNVSNPLRISNRKDSVQITQPTQTTPGTSSAHPQKKTWIRSQRYFPPGKNQVSISQVRVCNFFRNKSLRPRKGVTEVVVLKLIWLMQVNLINKQMLLLIEKTITLQIRLLNLLHRRSNKQRSKNKGDPRNLKGNGLHLIIMKNHRNTRR